MHILRVNDQRWKNISRLEGFSAPDALDEIFIDGVAVPLLHGSGLEELAEFVEAVAHWVSTSTHGVKTPMEVLAEYRTFKAKFKKKEESEEESEVVP